MMNTKQMRSFILSVIALLLIVMIPCSSHAKTSTKQGVINYTVSIDLSGKGSLYWDYGKNMSFFLENGYKTYNSDCKVKENTTYKFSKLFDRGLISKPNDGHYFDGFYNEKGKKINLTETNIDILRVSVHGIYYYDYFDSYDNPKYENYTEAAYKKKVQAYVKKLYGTSRYKVMDTVVLYEVPKKDAEYTAKFKAKSKPSISYNSTITKTYGNRNFYVIPSKPSKYTYTFKSSNSNVIKIDKTTGYASIKGPGTATITCTVAETKTTLPATYKIKITVKPGIVTSLSAVKETTSRLAVSWNCNSKNSGYELQVSNNKSFVAILAEKKVLSGSISSTHVGLKTQLFNNYVRIRAYKTSNGKKIYGPYTVTKILVE